MATKNYLLGYGERLNEKLDPPKRRPDKVDVYTFAEAKARLAPKVVEVFRSIADLPKAACPHDQSVAVITLHPSYLAKSFYPSNLLRTLGLDAIGSRSRRLVPEKTVGKRTPETKELATAEIFVSGTRPQFASWARNVASWTTHMPGAEELIRVEQVYVPRPEDRLLHTREFGDAPLLEIVSGAGTS